MERAPPTIEELKARAEAIAQKLFGLQSRNSIVPAAEVTQAKINSAIANAMQPAAIAEKLSELQSRNSFISAEKTTKHQMETAGEAANSKTVAAANSKTVEAAKGNGTVAKTNPAPLADPAPVSNPWGQKPAVINNNNNNGTSFKENRREESSSDNISSYDPSELRVFVKNLKISTTEATLKAYFSRWGVVSDVFIRQSSANYTDYSGSQHSMGYVTFAKYYNESPLNIPIHVIDGMSVPINKVVVMPLAAHHENVTKSRTLMVNGTIHELPDRELMVYFGKFGAIERITRKRDPKNPRYFTRFAFICFGTQSAVDQAVEKTSHIVKGQVVDVRRVKDLIYNH